MSCAALGAALKLISDGTASSTLNLPHEGEGIAWTSVSRTRIELPCAGPAPKHHHPDWPHRPSGFASSYSVLAPLSLENAGEAEREFALGPSQAPLTRPLQAGTRGPLQEPVTRSLQTGRFDRRCRRLVVIASDRHTTDPTDSGAGRPAPPR